MMRIVKTAFGILLLGAIQHTIASETEILEPFSARFTHEDGVYEISALRLDWFSARNLCRIEGKDLVSIETVGENSAVMNAVSAMTTESFWIAGSDIYQDDAFYWDSTGIAIGPFQNWGPDEPSGDGDCVELAVAMNHLWNDYNCDAEKLFICEWHPCPNVTSF